VRCAYSTGKEALHLPFPILSHLVRCREESEMYVRPKFASQSSPRWRSSAIWSSRCRAAGTAWRTRPGKHGQPRNSRHSRAPYLYGSLYQVHLRDKVVVRAASLSIAAGQRGAIVAAVTDSGPESGILGDAQWLRRADLLVVSATSGNDEGARLPDRHELEEDAVVKLPLEGVND
jgi:hypothetical protein